MIPFIYILSEGDRMKINTKKGLALINSEWACWSKPDSFFLFLPDHHIHIKP